MAAQVQYERLVLRPYAHPAESAPPACPTPVQGDPHLPFVARLARDEIALEGRFNDETITRWIFSDVTADRFGWRAVESRHGGATWTTVQELAARRSPG